jgi:ADP-ribose pyrophosphatase
MPLKEWNHKSTKSLFKNPWWEYLLDECFIPNGNQYEYHYVHTGGSVMVIPVTDKGKILMVKQYRYLNRHFSIEFPAGGMKPGQDPYKIARKELIEETGYEGKLEKIGIFNPYNGITDENCHVFTASDLLKSDAETKDEQEDFEIIELTPPEIEEKMCSNEITDGMSMASWTLVKHLI